MSRTTRCPPAALPGRTTDGCGLADCADHADAARLSSGAPPPATPTGLWGGGPLSPLDPLQHQVSTFPTPSWSPSLVSVTVNSPCDLTLLTHLPAAFASGLRAASTASPTSPPLLARTPPRHIGHIRGPSSVALSNIRKAHSKVVSCPRENNGVSHAILLPSHDPLREYNCHFLGQL